MCNCETCDGTGRLTEHDPETGSWTIQCDDCQGTGIGEDPIQWHWEEIADDLWEMNNNHTNGPWFIEEMSFAPRFSVVAASTGTELCRLLDEPDAKLIIASPSLLEVCELADELPEINFNNYDESDVQALQEWAFRVHDAMTAARKLATE